MATETHWEIEELWHSDGLWHVVEDPDNDYPICFTSVESAREACNLYVDLNPGETYRIVRVETSIKRKAWKPKGLKARLKQRR